MANAMKLCQEEKEALEKVIADAEAQSQPGLRFVCSLQFISRGPKVLYSLYNTFL